MKGIDFDKICEDHGIKVRPYSNPKTISVMEKLQLSKQNAGYSIVVKNGSAILYDDNRPEIEACFTLAHELGHILLGHLTFRKGVGKYPEHMEAEANIFAAVLVASNIISQYGVSVIPPAPPLAGVLAEGRQPSRSELE